MKKLESIGLNTKILLLTLFTGLIPLLAVSAFISTTLEQSLQEHVQSRLHTIAQAKQNHLYQYFNTIEHQVENLAHNQMVIDAAESMSDSFYTVGAENRLTSEKLQEMKLSVRDYYTKEFAPKYAEANINTTLNVDTLVESLSPDSIVQQYHYISNNPNELGNKDDLITAGDASLYSKQHAQVHPILKRYQDSFGYYDIFIVHPTTGDIVYSVYKELDFGTSLKTGNYANSNFATAYKMALSLPAGESALVDFATYTPSYSDPASFIASPIYKGETLVGVLCFQMPLERITNILADDGEESTQEVVLIGQDGLMRSNSRLKPDTHSVVASFHNPEAGAFSNPELKQSFTTAFDDQQSLELMDYRGQEVVLNRKRLDLGGMQLLLIAKIDTREAYDSIDIIRSIVIWSVTLSILFIVFTSLFMSRKLANPIADISDRLNNLANGALNQPHFEDPASDEVGTLQAAFNDLLDMLRTMVENTTSLSENLTSTASTLLTTAQEQQTGTAEQASAAEETKNLLSMLLDSSKEVAQASQLVFDNADITQKNASLIATRIDELSHHVDGIGEILSLIKDIAAKSDLLALNAALEGTKAGEAGRGFSLVAMQMQKLAEQVMTSAKNIDALTGDITKSTNASVLATEEATKLATETTKSAHQITFAVQQQQEGTQEASIALDEIAQVASEAAVAAHSVVETSDALLKLSAQLQESVERFQL